MKESLTLMTFRCQGCLGHFPEADSVYYETVLELKSGAGQMVLGETSAESTGQQIDELLKVIESSDQKKLEEDVYMKKQFFLCRDCRLKLLRMLNYR
ncbi:MAG: hypothetical protein PHW04_18825 [Candidatus Wallbacteria bacterium]|nr:hypothetical protein [Candidatus Wallbacteria bacterium]